MGGCINKCCLSIIAIGILTAWLILVNMKPDMLKNGFASFIDMLQIKKTEIKQTRETYRKREDIGYTEPSAFESE